MEQESSGVRYKRAYGRTEENGEGFVIRWPILVDDLIWIHIKLSKFNGNVHSGLFMMMYVQHRLKILTFTGLSICVSWSPKLRRTTNGVNVVPYNFCNPSIANIVGKLCLCLKVSYFKR
jgi:hypothetical protein